MKPIYFIILLLVLCAGSFWLGTRQIIVEESTTATVVAVDSTLYEDPAPPIAIKPIDSVVVKKLPIVNYDKLKLRIIDSLITAGYSLKDAEIVSPTILPDSANVVIPMTQSIFKEEGKYEIGVTGYNTSLDYAKIFNTNTTITNTNTLRSPTKHWSVNSSLNSFTFQGKTDLAIELGVEYRKDRWTINGGYQVGFDGTSGFVAGVTFTLLDI